MAEKSFAGGMIALYGVAIGNALSPLSKGQTSVDDLVALRDQAKAIVTSQGDLVAALRELEAEIARRGGVKGPPEPASERFVAQIDGLALPDAIKAEIEQSLQTAVMAEIAKIDTGGDMVASPLSTIKSFGLGLGSRTPGIAIVARNLNIR
ncbi:MAG TPA: DUF1843 domain-containing protein [Pseudolabrys sp.]|jgi:hypothetical protein